MRWKSFLSAVTVIGGSVVGPVMAEDLGADPFGDDFLRRVEQTRHVEIPTYDESTLESSAPSIAPASFEATESFENRLKSLEDEWSKYKSGVDKKKADAAKKPTYKIGGRIHADHWSFLRESDGINWFENPSGTLAGTDPEDRLLFRRLRVETKGDVFETMLYDFDFDFATPGTVEIKDAYLGFQNLPNNQQLLIGNQKRPLGLDHLNSSRFNVFAERPLVVETFNEDARRLGIAMYGYTDDESLHWRYGVYNLDNIKSTGKYIGDDYQLSFNARLSGSPWYDESSGGRGYFHWAVATMIAHPDGNSADTASNSNESVFATRPEARSTDKWLDTGAINGAHWYEILAFESIVNVGALQVVGEYQTNWVQREDGDAGTGPDLFFHGAYIYAAYMLTGEHVPYDRKTGTIGRLKPFENFFLVDRCNGESGHGWGAWQIALRYSYLDITDQDIQGGVGNNWTLGMNWYWTSHSKMQFNLIYGTIEQHEAVNGFTDGDFLIAGTRLMVDF